MTYRINQRLMFNFWTGWYFNTVAIVSLLLLDCILLFIEFMDCITLHGAPVILFHLCTPCNILLKQAGAQALQRYLLHCSCTVSQPSHFLLFISPAEKWIVCFVSCMNKIIHLSKCWSESVKLYIHYTTKISCHWHISLAHEKGKKTWIYL